MNDINMFLILVIVVPLIVGLISLFFKKSKMLYWLSLISTSICLFTSWIILFSPNRQLLIKWLEKLNFNIILQNDFASSINVILASFFAFIIVVFSKRMLSNVKANIYYSFILLFLAFTNLTILSKNLFIFLISWEILGLLTYLLIRFVTDKDEFSVATKTLVILGITDFCLLVGSILLFVSTGDYIIKDFGLDIGSNSLLFTLLTISALGKLGAVPFHNWIPDTAEKLPSALMGYLVGAIDKIIGIYWLTIILKDIFVLQQHNILMFIGSLTILIAVFMALQQHNLKKLLSYHAISQIGYMILGISTGTIIGIVGGIFHMVNNTIYKTLLFLSSGVVEQTAGDIELSHPKGLTKFLPYSFIFTIVAALSISGIPPFNGFFSKWIIYQSVIESIFKSKSILAVLALISAMFGSALTLASFVKVLHSLFLSKPEKEIVIKEEKFEKFFFIFPMATLALLCIIFGIFAYEVPIRYIIYPTLKINSLSIFGNWNAKLSAYLIFAGVLLGFIIYILFVDKPRKVKTYLLGEEDKLKDSIIPATDFYLTIAETYPFSVIYEFAKNKLLDFYSWFYGIISLLSFLIKFVIQLEVFDVYILGKKVIFKISENLSKLHNGNLHSYLSWVFVGILVLFLAFIL
ncbi:MAG: proton-conducting transporter membrane subunit [Endomicrobia bacterium]|nr:proton-conducting transporter membrane subunit [Endomicrobiia bacterium]